MICSSLSFIIKFTMLFEYNIRKSLQNPTKEFYRLPADEGQFFCPKLILSFEKRNLSQTRCQHTLKLISLFFERIESVSFLELFSILLSARKNAPEASGFRFLTETFYCDETKEEKRARKNFNQSVPSELTRCARAQQFEFEHAQSTSGAVLLNFQLHFKKEEIFSLKPTHLFLFAS